MIVLVGFMGSGKTTTGRLLAERLNVPFIDTDELVEQAAGMPVKQLFEEEGEARFRTLEREAVARALEGPEAVVALGGGAVHDPVTCSLLSWHTVVFLDVPYAEAMRRIGHDPGRPMLHLSDPSALYAERGPIYERLATHAIDALEAAPPAIVDAVVQKTGLLPQDGPARVTVDLGSRSYPVLIGEDISEEIASLLDLGAIDRAFLITHRGLVPASKPLVDSLGTMGIQVDTIFVEEGERSKQLTVVERVAQEMALLGAHRSDLIVSFGGGVVCDLAGFLASIYHRGIPVLHVPTTLLAQVDAAIGGKTAVNLAQAKNVIGTIHQPLAVVCDVSLLRSLPVEELRSGLAEVAKYGFISDPELLRALMEEGDHLMTGDPGVLTKVVRRSAEIKARVVSRDERDEGHREILNYGHTFGHAIEHQTGLRHGEAISVGMMAAAYLAEDVGMLDGDSVRTHSAVLSTVGLPLSARFDLGQTVSILGRDKKNRGTRRFILLEAIGSPRAGIPATDSQIDAALRKVAI